MEAEGEMGQEHPERSLLGNGADAAALAQPLLGDGADAAALVQPEPFIPDVTTSRLSADGIAVSSSDPSVQVLTTENSHPRVDSAHPTGYASFEHRLNNTRIRCIHSFIFAFSPNQYFAILQDHP